MKRKGIFRKFSMFVVLCGMCLGLAACPPAPTVSVSSVNEGGEAKQSETYRIENDAIGQAVLGETAVEMESQNYALKTGSVPSM